MRLFRRRPAPPPALTLEGVLGPNERLDAARAIAVPEPAVICVSDGALLVSSGARLLRLTEWDAGPAEWVAMPDRITALAAGPGGLVAVGLADGTLRVLDGAGTPQDWAQPEGLRGIADLMVLGPDEIAVLDSGYAADEPMLSLASWDEAARGRVVAVARDGRQRVLAERLHCPTGIAPGPDGAPVVCEFERARIVALDGTVLRRGLPGYLGRLRRIGGGYALACPSRRDPLIEFLKTEPDFVRLMKRTVDPAHWIAPRAAAGFAHDLPIELGATRLYGEIKPWAPSFSYGLVLELDADLSPTGAAHSRANRRRHAISDVAEWRGRLVAVSQASGELLSLDGEGT